MVERGNSEDLSRVTDQEALRHFSGSFEVHDDASWQDSALIDSIR